MAEQFVLMHGPTDAAAMAAALAHVGWGRGRQAIRGGRPTWTGQPIEAGEDAAGRVILAAGRGPEMIHAARGLASLFGLCGLHERLSLQAVETNEMLCLGPAALTGTAPIVVYACPTGAHAAVAAAAIHTGLLPADRLPGWRELLSVPQFDRLTNAHRGEAIFIGHDQSDRAVYAIGLGQERQLLRRLAVRTLRKVAAGPLPLQLVDAAVAAHPLLQVGGFLSRGLGLSPLGRPLVATAMRQAYRQLAALVADTLRELGRTQPGTAAANTDPGQGHSVDAGQARSVDHGQTISHTRWNDPR